MVDIEVGQVGGHQRRVGQARGRVLAGMAGDRQGLLDHGTHRGLPGIAGGGRALALPHVDGDGDPLVPGQLHRLHLALADADADALVDAGPHLAGIGP